MKTTFLTAAMLSLPCLLVAEGSAFAAGPSTSHGSASLRQALTKVEDHHGVGGQQTKAMRSVQPQTAAGHIAAAAAVRSTTGGSAPMLRKLPFSPIARESGPGGSTTRIGFARAGVTFSKHDVYSKSAPHEKIGTETSRVRVVGYGRRSVVTTSTNENGIASKERTETRSTSTPIIGTYKQASTTTSTHVHQGGATAHVEVKSESGDSSQVGIYARSSATARVTQPRATGGHEVQEARAQARGDWPSHASVKIVSEGTTK